MNFTNTHTASIIPFIPFTSTRNDDAPDSVNTQSPANFVTNDQLYSTNSTTVDIGYSYFSAATQPPFKATTFDQFPNSPVTYSDPLTSQHSNVTVRSHSIESHSNTCTFWVLAIALACNLLLPFPFFQLLFLL